MNLALSLEVQKSMLQTLPPLSESMLQLSSSEEVDVSSK